MIILTAFRYLLYGSISNLARPFFAFIPHMQFTANELNTTSFI